MARFSSKTIKKFSARTQVFVGGRRTKIGLVTPGIRRSRSRIRSFKRSSKRSFRRSFKSVTND